MNWFINCFTKENYFNLNGRARRQEYWMIILISCIIIVVASIVSTLLSFIFAPLSFIVFIVELPLLAPCISAGVRRLHDTDKPGWWLLVPVMNIVYLATDSTPGSNQYGKNPKGIQ